MIQRNPEDISLVWKHTHSDFKSVIDGQLFIMYPAPYGGLGTIYNMPEDAFLSQLEYAKRKEAWLVRSNKLKPIMQKHGILGHFCSTHQWRDTLQDVKTFAGFAVKSNIVEAITLDIQNAGIEFPA